MTMPGAGGLGDPLAFGLGDDGSLTAAELEVYDWLLALWPPGVRDLYDIGNPTADVEEWFRALAESFYDKATSIADSLPTELNPSTCVKKLPDWEAALGIAPYPLETTAQRQAGVTSGLRQQSCGFNLPDLRSIIGPLLGYADPTQLHIVETVRTALDAALLQTNSTGATITGGGSIAQTVKIADGGKVSVAGARLQVHGLTYSNAADVSVKLQGPDGTSVTWSGASFVGGLSGGTVILRSLAFAGAAVYGTWKVTVSSVAGNVGVTSWDLLAPGAGRDSATSSDGNGSEVYQWGFYVDPALIGVAAPCDVNAALRAAQRALPAHTQVYPILSPLTGVVVGSSTAIVGRCVVGH